MRSSTSSSPGRATFTLDGETVPPRPARHLRQGPRHAAPRGRGRGGDEDSRRRRAARGHVRGVPVGALGRGAPLLDDRGVGPRDRHPRGRSSPTIRDNANVLYNLACAESRVRPRRHGARPPAAGDRAGAELRRPSPGDDADLDSIRSDARFPASLLSYASPGSRGPPPARGSRAQGRAPAGPRAGRAECSGPASAETSSSSPTASANALCASSPAEGDELLGLRAAGDHVAVRDGAHRDIRDERLAVARGDRDRERVRPRQRRSAAGWRQASRRGGGEDGDEPPGREVPRPAAERAGREAARRRRRAARARSRRRGRRRRSPQA